MHASNSIDIAQATTAQDMHEIAQLFQIYAAALAIDLSYQDFAAELAQLPGSYAPPKGALLLARNQNGEALGCVALRPLPLTDCCEMKRLFISPEARGMKLGRKLVDAIIDQAIHLGYREMRLDTLPHLREALGLYEQLGFVRIPAYYDTPLAETVFLSKRLQA